MNIVFTCSSDIKLSDLEFVADVLNNGANKMTKEVAASIFTCVKTHVKGNWIEYIPECYEQVFEDYSLKDRNRAREILNMIEIGGATITAQVLSLLRNENKHEEKKQVPKTNKRKRCKVIIS